MTVLGGLSKGIAGHLLVGENGRGCAALSSSHSFVDDLRALFPLSRGFFGVWPLAQRDPEIDRP